MSLRSRCQREKQSRENYEHTSESQKTKKQKNNDYFSLLSYFLVFYFFC